MAVLNEKHKVFIVTRLACYDSPSMVAAAVKEEFGITVQRNQIGLYDASKASAVTRMAKHYKDLFASTRKAFLKNTASIPVANKAVRLALLNTAVYSALEKKNVGLMASLLEQAAKEVGESFTNKSHVRVNGSIDTNSISDADLVKKLASYGITATLPTPPGASNAG